ncbi:transcription termination/antitermination NusG family protein [Thermoanaerobacterium thermosaccharolyticum]|uniref:transcription termination/antitermination NusG family protein n=1 Tax=Thermoanaerobacterium thermosaccharolyticum TaxID=1517 RepID=UPI003DA883B4
MEQHCREKSFKIGFIFFAKERKIKLEKWYVVQTFTNQEEKVREKLIKLGIINVAIPTTIEIITKNGKEKTKTVKKYPNYVFFKAEMTAQNWHKIKNIQEVMWFTNVDAIPAPLTDEEVLRLQLEENF